MQNILHDTDAGTLNSAHQKLTKGFEDIEP